MDGVPPQLPDLPDLNEPSGRLPKPSSRALVLVDQAPLLARAMGLCQQSCRLLEQLRSELEQHETRDLPAYDRWYRDTWGGRLDELTRLAREINTKEERLSQLRKTHWARFFGATSPMAACASPGWESLASGQSAWNFWEGDAEDPFDLQDAYGLDPDEIADWGFDEDADDAGPGSESTDPEDGAWEENEAGLDADRFEDFFVRGRGRREGRYQSRGAFDSDRSGPKVYQQFRGSSPSGAGHKARGQADPLGRLKERYRLLARKLHPDLNSELTGEKKKLWVEGQKAYREKDVERLDLLIAIVEAVTGELSRHTSLGQLRRARIIVQRSIRPLQERLIKARQSNSWQFLQNSDKTELQERIDAELERQRHELLLKTRRLDEQLEETECRLRRRTNHESSTDERSPKCPGSTRGPLDPG